MLFLRHLGAYVLGVLIGIWTVGLWQIPADDATTFEMVVEGQLWAMLFYLVPLSIIFAMTWAGRTVLPAQYIYSPAFISVITGFLTFGALVLNQEIALTAARSADQPGEPARRAVYWVLLIVLPMVSTTLAVKRVSRAWMPGQRPPMALDDDNDAPTEYDGQPIEPIGPPSSDDDKPRPTPRRKRAAKKAKKK